MTIRTKLILSFSIVACVPLVGGAIGLLAHRSAVQRLKHTLSVSQQGLALLKAGSTIQNEVSSEQAAWLGDVERKPAPEVLVQDLLTHDTAIKQQIAAITALATSCDLDIRFVETTATAQETLVNRARSGALVFGDFARVRNAARDLMDAAQLRNLAALRVDDPEFSASRKLYDAVMGVGTLLGVIMGITFGVLMSLAVTRHIGEIACHMWDGTCNVAVAASQVAASSRELASASSQQAASIEETSASLTEVNSMVKTNASHAKEVRAISHENRQTSDRSATEIADLQIAMQEMTSANGNIAKIVKSIDEIAFQTNILALNAAVEAARAGESGAGFAVVAEEVRNLAQRSAGAARETGDKIEDALNKSRRGAEIAGRVEQSLRKVIDDNRRVDDIVARIAEASAEQAKGLDLAVNSMTRIDQLTQSNTANAESTAEAAQLLDTESRGLKQELSVLMDRREEPDSASTHRPGATVQTTPMATSAHA